MMCDMYPPVFQDPPLSAHKQPGVPKLYHFVQGPMVGIINVGGGQW